MADIEKNGRFRVEISLLIQVVIYVIVVSLAYAALDKRITVLEGLDKRISTLEAIDRRTTTLEVKADQTSMDLAEIKADVKRLLGRP